jgi:Flp pilus assembly protein TadB
VSSALLYLAIVAIWALVLVPRWVRPRHSAARARASQQTLESHLTEPAWPRRVEDFAWADEDEDGQDDVVRHDEEIGQEGDARPDRVAGQEGDARPDRVAAERASILRARRRALIALLVLTGGAVGIAARHLAAVWVVIPPAVMLAGYVLLLREAGRSDARRAREAADRRQAAAGTVGRPAGAGAAGGTEQPEPATAPGAQIIDISARVGDQLYDQYADAEVRAVGD